jgi:hypothetical protein
MNRIGILFVGILLAAASCIGQDSASAPAQAAPAAAAIGHGAFPVKLTKTLDSSKLKEGDPVEAETAGSFKLPDGTLVPKGSKMTGHVISAKARSKGDSQSQLAVAFDRLNVVNGKQLPLKGTVQALFQPPDEQDPGIPSSTMSKGGATMAGGGTSAMPTPGYQPTDVKSGSNTTSGAHVEPAIDPKSVGVHGFDNLQLEDGVLSSKGKNVKLGSGVRMIVRVDILG